MWYLVDSCVQRVASSVLGGIESVAVQGPGCMGRPQRAGPSETQTSTVGNTDTRPARYRGREGVFYYNYHLSNLELNKKVSPHHRCFRFCDMPKHNS